MTTLDRDQKVFILVTPLWPVFLGAIGDRARRDGPYALNATADGWGPYLDMPTILGFYVWEGDVESFPGDSGPGGNDPQDPSITWHGEWRKATLADFEAFGITLPKA